jgi:menaquinone-dependent protoporphyrinogen oxidase
MSTQKLPRRHFLKLAGLALAGTAITCSGLGYAATRVPEVPTPELTFKEETTMTQRILVTYATRAGSTAEIAAAIGETLAARGFSVDVTPAKAQPALDGYAAVILGSPIRMGTWLPEVVRYVEAHQTALSTLPTALFTVHMQNAGDDETSRAARDGYLGAIRPLLPNAENVYFQGALDFSRLSLLDRLISKMVKAVESDQRDWDAIKRWAEAISISASL